MKERAERESTRSHEEKAVKESDDTEKPVLKKQFDKKEVMRSFRQRKTDLKTVAVSKSKNPVSKKPAEKLEPVKRKVEIVAREISDDSPSEILKKRPSKEALASKNEQNTKKNRNLVN